jgi:hypothetical protein
MTREEMIAAREAFKKRGFWPNEVMWGCWRDAWGAGVEAERERCAKLCETPIDEVQITDDCAETVYMDANECAAAIRKGE